MTSLASWLETLVRMIPNARQAIAWEGESHRKVSWPSGKAVDSALESVAKMALEQEAPVTVATDKGTIVSCPLSRPGSEPGAVAIQAEVSEAQSAALKQVLAWGCAWLDLIPAESSGQNKNSFDTLVSDLLLVPSDQFADVVVEKLVQITGARRVILGTCNHKSRFQLAAVSDTAKADKRLDLAGLALAVMAESLGQGSIQSVVEEYAGQPAHSLLLAESGVRQVISLPLATSRPVGALLLLLETPLPESQSRILESLISPLSTLLEWHTELAVNPFTRFWRRQADRLVSHRLRWSLVAGVMLVAVVLLIGGRSDYEVGAPATLAGQVQQAVVAPIDGYIRESMARAGDRVARGQALARLDDRETTLELRKSDSELDALDQQYRQALAEGNRSESSVAQARREQVEARRDLLQTRLAQLELKAPLDGVILSGDLSRSLGAPVKRGEQLFEVAPLEGFRVLIYVPEADVDEVQVGQTGWLRFNAHPDARVEFRTVAVTSVLDSYKNLGVVFLIEAEIVDRPSFLRPGMEGHARINVGEKRWGWILFHDLVDWFRMLAWRYLP